MDEVRMNMSRVALIAVAIAAFAGIGCGESSASGTGDSSSASQERLSASSGAVEPAHSPNELRRLLREAIPKIESRSLACTIVSDHFLRENYGAPGEIGRRHCEKVARMRPQQHIRFYRIRDFKPKRATVFVATSSGQHVLFYFVLASDSWLIDSLDILGN
jgi:hypothetical protein